MVDFAGLLTFILSTQAWFVLGAHSIYKTAEVERVRFEKETMHELANTIDVFRQQLRIIFGIKSITYTVVLVSVLIALMWALYRVVVADWVVAAWAFSLGLVEALILFFSVLTLYHLVSHRLLPALANSQLFESVVTWSSFSGALVISLTADVGCMYSEELPCSVVGALDYFSYFLFFGVLFVTGLGAIGIVETVSESISSQLPRDRKKRAAYIVLIFLGLAITLITLGSGIAGINETALFGVVGIELALLAVAIYTAYSLARRKTIHQSNLVYVALMLAGASLFVGYALNGLALPNLSTSGLPLADSIEQFAFPLLLFAVGYLGILLQIPQKLERRLGVFGDKIAPLLTFLLLFTALAQFQLAVFSFNAGLFLFEKEIPVVLGLLVGIVVFGTRRLHRGWRGGSKQATTIPFCNNCGSRLKSSSKFCWSCGNAISSETEQVWFVGDGKVITMMVSSHSTRRKVASLVGGGPVGYIAFGRNTDRIAERKGRLVVTNKAMYFADEFFPIDRISAIKTGDHLDSLSLKIIGEGSSKSTAARLDIEIKANNPDAFSEALARAKRERLRPLSC